MTLGTPKLTPKQQAILAHLHKRGHAMFGMDICGELGYRYIGVDTWAKLNGAEYIRRTTQGWLITDSGKLRVEEGV